MKILVVVPDLNLGGVTSSAINFCKECASRGNHVDILVMDGAKAGIKNVSQIFLSGQSLFWNLNPKQICKYSGLSKLLLYALGGLKHITNRFGLWLPIIFRDFKLKGDYDVAVAYRQCAPCYYFTLNCVSAKKKIGMIHGNLNFMGDTSSWDKYFPKFDKVACVSNAISRDFINNFPLSKDRFITIYNMFDINDIVNKSKMQCHLPIDHQSVNIVSITRHENNLKKTNRIIEACAELKKRNIHKFHWYIAGDGPDYEANVKLADELGVTDLITFCGPMENPYSLQSKCDFSVLTSATEAFSMSVIESLILKKPIVVMKYPGVEEAVRNKYNGIIAEQTMTSLLDSLILLINNKQEIISMARNLETEMYNNNVAYQQLLNAIN